jgi:hypothetical protein
VWSWAVCWLFSLIGHFLSYSSNVKLSKLVILISHAQCWLDYLNWVWWEIHKTEEVVMCPLWTGCIWLFLFIEILGLGTKKIILKSCNPYSRTLLISTINLGCNYYILMLGKSSKEVSCTIYHTTVNDCISTDKK